MFPVLDPPKHTVIYINSETGWQKIEVDIVYHPVYDIAVMHYPSLDKEATGFTLCGGGGGYDVPLIFLGFPFQRHVSTDATITTLAPYIKHAFLAGSEDIGNTHSMLVLDVENNYGFSGGPVLMPKTDLPLHYCVYGVTASFTYGLEPVQDENGKKTKLSAPYNSGLMNAVPDFAIKELFSDMRKQLTTKK